MRWRGKERLLISNEVDSPQAGVEPFRKFSGRELCTYKFAFRTDYSAGWECGPSSRFLQEKEHRGRTWLPGLPI